MYSRTLFPCLFLFCFISTQAAQALPVNGDFAAGVSSWTTSGQVSAPAGQAVLNDLLGDASLYQVVSLGLGEWTLTFDFQNSIAAYTGDDDPFAFPDVLFASLYFSDSIGFDLAAPPSTAIALMDLDHSGPANVSGTITPGELPGWQHFSLSFTSTSLYAVVAFELLAFDPVNGNSSAAIDNVNLAAVPEPMTGLLLGAGLVAAGLRRRRERRS